MSLDPNRKPTTPPANRPSDAPTPPPGAAAPPVAPADARPELDTLPLPEDTPARRRATSQGTPPK